jgi:hypothetical protein
MAVSWNLYMLSLRFAIQKHLRYSSCRNDTRLQGQSNPNNELKIPVQPIQYNIVGIMSPIFAVVFAAPYIWLGSK